MKLRIIQLPKEELVKVEKSALSLNLWPIKTKIEVITTIVESRMRLGNNKGKYLKKKLRQKTECVFHMTLTQQ